MYQVWLKSIEECYMVKIWPGNLDLWPWKSIGFQILLRTKYVPSLVKIHWRMLILECSQGCYGRTRYYIPSQLSWRGDKNWRPFKHVHVCLHNSLYCLTTEESCILYMYLIVCIIVCAVWLQKNPVYCTWLHMVGGRVGPLKLYVDKYPSGSHNLLKFIIWNLIQSM
jgi:hypothetical protein